MYQGFQDLAAVMLEKFGRLVTLTKPSYTGDNLVYDPDTGTYVTVDPEEPIGSPDTGSVKAVFVGITAQWKEKFAIQEGDSVALVAADGLEPEQNDVIDGWTILAVEQAKPADIVVLYKCHVRKQ